MGDSIQLIVGAPGAGREDKGLLAGLRCHLLPSLMCRQNRLSNLNRLPSYWQLSRRQLL